MCHHCDTPACVNPAHLFVGAYGDNEADKAVKARTPSGEAHPMAKLTRVQVDDIRARYDPRKRNQSALAREYGITQPAVWRIVNGEVWR